MMLLSLLCLLSSAFGPASAQDISSVVTVSEGEDAVLKCSLDGSVNKFDWKKDKTHVGMYNNGEVTEGELFKDRIKFFKEEVKSGNASIKIIKTDWKDSGTYTCVLFRPDGNKDRDTLVTLNVGAAREPSVRIQDKGTWCLLTCSALGVPEPELEWRNAAGEVQEHFKHSTENQNGQVNVTLQVIVTKSDNYTCVATQKSIYHKICSKTQEVTIEGATQEPYTRIQDEGTWCLLECSALGVPEPELEWINYAGEVQGPTKTFVKEQNGQFHVTVQVNVTKSDYYTCVASQQSVGHQISSKPQKVTIQGVNIAVIAVIVAVCFLASVVLIVVIIVLKKNVCTPPRHLTGSGEPRTPLKEGVQ